MSTKLSGYNKKAIFYVKTTHLCYNIQKIGFSALYRVFFMLAIAVLSPRVCATMLTPMPNLSPTADLPSPSEFSLVGLGVVLYNKLKSRVFEKQ